MKLRDILVVLDGTRRNDTVRDLAIGLARRHDAHLAGLCPLDLLFPASLTFALGGYPELLALKDAANQLEATALEKARKIEAGFRDQLHRNDIRGDWELVRGPVLDAIGRRARIADLLVLGQTDPDHPLPAGMGTLIAGALMNSGRPLLIIPFAGQFDTIGTNVLLGWNGTREAARAAHDALLVIEPGAAITVLTVERPRAVTWSAEVAGADAAEHLARHDFKVSTAKTVTDGNISDADAILSYASDCGADLLVVGGYGHSRMREMILGGVSRELLDHMTLPVLMSH